MKWLELAPLLFFQNRRRALVFLGVACVNALFEWLAVCSIYPLVALLTQPEVALHQPWLERAYQMVRPSSLESFQAAVGTAFMLIFFAANLLNALTYWLHLRYTLGLRHALSLHLLRVYLHKDYAWLLRQHTSDLVKNVLAEMDRIVYEMLAKVSTLAYRGMTALIILVGLVLVNPLVALSSALVLGCAYQLIYFFFRSQVERLGQGRLELNQRRHRLVQEALSALKEGRMLARRAWLDREFEETSRAYVRAESSQRLIAELPRHLTELLAVLAILLVFGFFVWRGGALAAVPLVGLYVLAIWRLIPALQEVYSCWVDVGYAWPSVREFLPLLNESVASEAVRPLAWAGRLALRQVSFTYPEAERPALRAVDLEIERGSLVGLVGRTGSGKTTTADLFGGFLSATEGGLEVDGQPLGSEELASWRQQVGYVPQTIYLSDHSVAANIAFGYPADQIDLPRVQEVARLAQIDERIQALPQQYGSPVGERGLTLSGGERQRLGLARALYGQPQLLILDEATSALDALTESQVLQALRQQQGQQTILLISHRLNSLRACSKIAVFSEGELVSQGSFAELQANCPVFQSLLSGHEIVEQ